MIIHKKNDDVCKNLEDYNSTKKINVLIVFDNMIPDMEANKRVNELFLRDRKLKILHVFKSQSFLKYLTL